MTSPKKPTPRTLGPQTSPGSTRTFDARPKPSNDRRREDSVHPSHHIDRVRDMTLDDPEAD